MKNALKCLGGLAVIMGFAAGVGCRNNDRSAAASDPVGGAPAPSANVPPSGGGPTNQAATDPIVNPSINQNAGAAAVNNLDRPTNPMTGTPSLGAIGGGPNRLSDGDIAAVTTAINQGEVQQAQIARTRARNPDVRQFAEHMAMQHQQLIQQQTALLGRSGVAAADNEVSHRMTQEGQMVTQSLQSATPDDFDRSYIDAQVREHQQALQEFDSQLLPNAQNAQFRQMLTDARAAVQQHLDDARRIQQSLMRTGGGAMGGAPSGGMGGMQNPTGTPQGGSHGMGAMPH